MSIGAPSLPQGVEHGDDVDEGEAMESEDEGEFTEDPMVEVEQASNQDQVSIHAS